MKEKSNKVYAIFDRNIVSSQKLCLHAIEGFDVKELGNALSLEDALKGIKKICYNLNYINDNTVYLFSNPVTNEKWYIGKYFIAVSKGALPEIILLKIYGDGITSLSWEKAAPLLKVLDVQNIQQVSRIGHLSLPDRGASVITGVNMYNKVSLPLVL